MSVIISLTHSCWYKWIPFRGFKTDLVSAWPDKTGIRDKFASAFLLNLGQNRLKIQCHKSNRQSPRWGMYLPTFASPNPSNPREPAPKTPMTMRAPSCDRVLSVALGVLPVS